MTTDPEIKSMLAECHRILISLQSGQHRATAPVLTVAEALKLVGKNSSSALYRWLSDKSIKPVSQGRYSRMQIERALADEAGVSFRRSQAQKRRAAA